MADHRKLAPPAHTAMHKSACCPCEGNIAPEKDRNGAYRPSYALDAWRGAKNKLARPSRSEIKASGDFHLLLASVAGNVILQRFMEELVARSSLVIALYCRSGVSSCGRGEHVKVMDALKNGNSELASALMLHHIDHIEADLDLRIKSGPTLSEALEF